MTSTAHHSVPLGEDSFWDAADGEVKPFLRWAGGKSWLLPLLKAHAPQNFECFYEPFLGGGAVLLSIPSEKKKIASDLNAELINAFLMVRDEPEDLISRLRLYGFSHTDYLDARTSFNNLKRDPDSSTLERAALFIYLNKTSFNGLYRENTVGDFNVPWGKREIAPANLENLIRTASKKLRGSGSSSPTEFYVGDYKKILRMAGPGDWVYLDPPYSPVSDTANFVGYTADGFDSCQQEILRDEADAARERGVQVLLSNADTAEVRKLYAKQHWRLHKFNVSRSVGALSSTRKKVPELLIKSYG